MHKGDLAHAQNAFEHTLTLIIIIWPKDFCLQNKNLWKFAKAMDETSNRLHNTLLKTASSVACKFMLVEWGSGRGELNWNGVKQRYPEGARLPFAKLIHQTAESFSQCVHMQPSTPKMCFFIARRLHVVHWTCMCVVCLFVAVHVCDWSASLEVHYLNHKKLSGCVAVPKGDCLSCKATLTMLQRGRAGGKGMKQHRIGAGKGRVIVIYSISHNKCCDL